MRLQSLEQDIEKNSPSLGRQAVYHETTRVSRLPSYLTVNMVRFYWRRDINKKTKIMRRVKFPFELDATELVTDSLKQKLLPVNEKLKDIDRDRRERAKTRRKTKKRVEQQELAKKAEAAGQPAPAQDPNDDPPEQMLTDGPSGDTELAAGELPDEETKREEELATLLSLVHPDLEADKGSNVSGLYELAGIVSHKGASADGGAYYFLCSAPAGRTADLGPPLQATTSAGVPPPPRAPTPPMWTRTRPNGTSLTTTRCRSYLGTRFSRSKEAVSRRDLACHCFRISPC